MTAPSNSSYTNEQKLVFAQEVFAAALSDAQGYHYTERLKKVLQYWGVFVPFPPRPMRADEGDISYVESLYDQLRPHVFEWATAHSMNALLASLKELLETIRKSGETAEAVGKSVVTFNDAIMKRITEIEARLEELESPNGGRLGDHR